MMCTPTRRRSYQDHRQYYENVKPKVITRWENGPPKIKSEKSGNKLERRMSDTFLVQPRHALTVDLLNHNVLQENEEEDNVFENRIEETEENGQETSFQALDSSQNKLSSTMSKFHRIFGKLREHMKADTTTQGERIFITKQIKNLLVSVNQVEFLMADLTERTNRMEMFLENRSKGLDWNYWQN